MTLIGTFSIPFEPEKKTEPQLLVGSQIGGRDFVKAMLRYMPPKSVALLVLSGNTDRVQTELARLSANEGGNYSSVPVTGPAMFDAVVGSGSIKALHSVMDPTLHVPEYIRRRFGGRPIPVSSLTHGLSQQANNWSMYARMLLTSTLPCDTVFCTSKAAQTTLLNQLGLVGNALSERGLKLGPQIKTEIVPLGVDVDLYRPRDKAMIRYNLGLPRDAIIILYLGRIDHFSKADLAPLLIAFDELVRRHGKKVMLLLAGGFSTSLSQQHVDRTVDALGCRQQVLVRHVPSPAEAPLYYSAADVFVSPVDTLQESFGISPLEAMASGLPAVVSGWSGYRETVVHGKTGFHASTIWADCAQSVSERSPFSDWQVDHLLLAQTIVVDVPELTNYLDVLVTNPDLRVKMGDCARIHVEANYSWPRVITRAREAWAEMIKIASSIDHLPEFRHSIEEARYFYSMSHYAMHCLGGGELAALTHRGDHVIGRRAKFLPLAPGLELRFDDRIFTFVLRLIKRLAMLRVRPTVSEIAEQISTKHKISRESAMVHIMWLFKYGYIQVEHNSS